MSADLDNDLLILLLDVARHVRTYANRLAKAQGMTQAQVTILTRLEHQPDLSQNELAAIAELAPMTIARLIDRLEELGLVRRCTDPQDRRIWRLRLTPAAAPLSREITRFRAKLHSAATKGIEPLVLTTIDLGLRQMKENVSACRSAEANAYGGSQCPA
jgi:MarR family transcriptional regulator, transcriptional regulator for hemolysin